MYQISAHNQFSYTNHTLLLQPGERTSDPTQQRADGSPKANAVRPLTDICDELKGRYPKDFKFTGWHPHCRCRAITILKTDEELARDFDRILAGHQPLPSHQSSRAVTAPPPAFTQWLEKNATRIQAAQQRGTLPYFLRDNAKYTDPTGTAANDVTGILKQGNYGAALKVGAKEQKIARRAYKHASKTQLTELQMENIQEIANKLGISRNKISPMDFNQADSGMGNIGFGSGRAYAINCPATIAAHEARLRGLNVTACGFDKNNSSMVRIRERFQEIWIDQATRRPPKPMISGITKYNGKKWTLKDDDIITKAESLMEAPGRYHIGINQLNGKGHVIVAERFHDGTLICFDAQNQTFVSLNDWQKLQYLEVVRVDNLIFNTNVLSNIIRHI